MSDLEKEIFATLKVYLRQCIEDYEDRWVTREVLHTLTERWEKLNETI